MNIFFILEKKITQKKNKPVVNTLLVTNVILKPVS